MSSKIKPIMASFHLFTESISKCNKVRLSFPLLLYHTSSKAICTSSSFQFFEMKYIITEVITSRFCEVHPSSAMLTFWPVGICSFIAARVISYSRASRFVNVPTEGILTSLRNEKKTRLNSTFERAFSGTRADNKPNNKKRFHNSRLQDGK